MKIMNMKSYIAAASLFLSAFVAGAQGLNQTVEVTRSYKGSIHEASKPQIQMQVPDSVLKFNYTFDYSVFDNPYKGTDYFNPYLLDMKPQTGYEKPKHFYLRAGAGLGMRPTLDFVLSPRTKGRFNYSFYASNRSFFHKYAHVAPMKLGASSPMPTLVTQDAEYEGTFPYKYDNYNGYDVSTKAGFNGRVDWEKCFMSMGVAYRGIQTKDWVSQRNAMNGGKVDFRIAANSFRREALYFDVKADYMYSANSTMSKSIDGLHDLNVGAVLGPVLRNGDRVLADADFGLSVIDGWNDQQVMNFSIAPKYYTERNRWRIAAGVRIATHSYSSSKLSDGERGNADKPAKGQVIYPDVRIGFEAARDRLNIVFSATGGEGVKSYTQQRERNHFFGLSYWHTYALLDNSIEQYNIALGLEGNFADKFKYSLKGGYASWKNGELDAIYSEGLNILPAVAYSDYQQVYVELGFAWNSARLDIESHLKYTDSSLCDDREEGFAEAPFSGVFSLRYNIRNRVFFGTTIEGRTRRTGYYVCQPLAGGQNQQLEKAKIPGFLNLCFDAEYAFSRKMSFWVEAGNVLSHRIQRTPLYCENPFSITAGIVLNL